MGKKNNGKMKAKYVVRNKYFDGNNFLPTRMGEDILNNHVKLYFDGQILYRYDGRVYKKDGEEHVRSLVQELLEDDSKKDRGDQVIYWLKNNRSIKGQTANPDDDLLNVENGLLNWKTGELFPHTHERIGTIKFPVYFDPTANDENVMNFIRSVVPEDAIDTIFEIIGYCLTMHCRYEKAFLFTGSGGNGKSTFINMVTAFLGQANISNITLQQLEKDRFKMALLQHKLVNTFADLPRNGLPNASNFKSIVSGDSVSAEFKGKDAFNFRPFAKLLFSANELPRSSDTTDGYYRRWIIIPFEKKFAPGTADVKLIDKITTPQALSTLLNYTVEGLKRLETNGKFTESVTTKKSLDQYKLENDNVEQFISECCIVDQKVSCFTKELYDSYQKWCKESGYKAFGKTNFNKKVQLALKLEQKRVHGESCNRWLGITLNLDNA